MANLDPQIAKIIHTSVRLKQETNELHRRLDSSALLSSMLCTPLDLSKYVLALCCFRHVYVALEPVLKAAENNHNIAADLRFFSRLPSLNIVDNETKILEVASSLQFTSSETQAILEHSYKAESHLSDQLRQGRYSIIAPPLSIASYWGMRYVLDGSCHGASILLPKFKKCLPSHVTELVEYWQSLSQQSKTWPICLKNLDQVNDQPASYNQIKSAAIETFDCFIAACSVGE
jgi:heme oxygenase